MTLSVCRLYSVERYGDKVVMNLKVSEGNCCGLIEVLPQNLPGGTEEDLFTYVFVVTCSAYSSILKMEAVASFETSVNQTTRRNIPKISTFRELRILPSAS
jgi:hypothetical protein